MKIQQFYDMKTLEESPDHWNWDISDEIFQELFGFDPYELDGDKVKVDTDNIFKRFKIENKLYRNQDYERSVGYNAYKFNGKYFALSVTSGRGQSDNSRLYITDIGLLNELRNEINNYRQISERLDIRKPDVEIEDLAHEYGYYVFEDPVTTEYKLISTDECFLSNKPKEGNDSYPNTSAYVLDAQELRDAFEKRVRPMVNALGGTYLNDNRVFEDNDIRQAYCQVVCDTLRIPEEDKAVVNIKNYKQKGIYDSFCSVVFRKDGECHGLFNSPSNYLNWILEDKVHYIGDESQFEKLQKKGMKGPEI